ncbi:MAG: 6,7-dimethyl-8-ribityllumazine synthase [Gammaproteobacteria bacterium]|nr:6,7-dimethyl-8-ribityllumazine synthase [Gammaproteobacteria bacterium]
MRKIEGDLVARNIRLVIVAGRFNELIVNALVQGARDYLQRHGVNAKEVDVIMVPGAFEIPLATKTALNGGSYDAAICLGAVIRGDTPHFEYVAGQCAAGLQKVQLETGKPAVFGVLTTDTVDQAMNRAGGKSGNKGAEAAAVALEMVNLLRTLED